MAGANTAKTPVVAEDFLYRCRNAAIISKPEGKLRYQRQRQVSPTPVDESVAGVCPSGVMVPVAAAEISKASTDESVARKAFVPLMQTPPPVPLRATVVKLATLVGFVCGTRL